MASESNTTFKEKWAGTSKERRQWAAHTVATDHEMDAKLIFIEIVVDNPTLVEANIRAKRHALGVGEPTAADLRESQFRIKQYARVYVSLQDDGSEDDLSYMKLYNYGGKVVTNRMHGYLRMRIAQFLTTVHTTPHVIYLSRHGQSEYNVLGKIGGNPPLSEAGSEYARRLGAWAPENICKATPSDARFLAKLSLGSGAIEGAPSPVGESGERRLVKARLWTSSLQRTILTAQHIPHPILPPSSVAYSLHEPPADFGENLYGLPVAHADEQQHAEGSWEQMSPRVYRNLDEIFAGEYEGMRYEDIQERSPDEATLRSMDKIGYRYPRGESYFDILSRLDPLVHEMESYHEPLLIVSHQAVLRLLYAYLKGMPRSKAPKIEIPLHTVMKIT